MVVLCHGIDSGIVIIKGRWWSNEVLCSLVQAVLVVRKFPQYMVTNGNFTLITNQHTVNLYVLLF